jgi:hypothetical protein
VTALAILAAGCSTHDKTYYAVERSGVVLGYLEAWTIPGDSATGEPTIERGKMVNRLTLLGRGMDITVEGERRADPVTGSTLHHDMTVSTGEMKTGATCVFAGDTVSYTLKPGDKTTTIVLDPDVITGDAFDFSYLADLKPGDEAVTKRFFDPLMGNVHTKQFTPVDAETLIVAGVPYDCLIFDTYNETAGAASRLWVERGTGLFLRDESPDGASITLSDASVRRRVRRADVDDMILAEVDVEIAAQDVRSIASMKVRAKVRTVGQRVTAESLNVPGQTFSGTVENNLIEGVFEVAHPKYDGSNPPPFPPDVGEDLERYLEPEIAIESDDPRIRDKALELTDGATDSWDAVRRLSHFVATEIGGDIPGGGSALGTLRVGKAECGGHSRLLAALCRSVGIPARTVMGCMYGPMNGGAFGQHMWDEVHMGEAGWIPIDATAREVDYVDSGHIRLGTLSSFNPIEMEILDHAIGPPVPDPLEDL